jgi:uncharacterized oxidoreductase
MVQAARINAGALEALATRAFEAVGSPPDEARMVAAHLVLANLVGHDSHGVIRLRDYVPWAQKGMVVPGARATVVHETPLALTVDGGLGFGQAIGETALALAIQKARASGLALLGIRNTGHLGRIGHWAERAAAAGLVSLHFVNTSGYGVLVAPYGSHEARLSANPIAAGVPVDGGDPVILDISTASIAEGKIKVARNAGKPLPEGCVVDAEGRPTQDANAFYGPPRGAILPFGGHKGYGLSVLVELLAGALTGGGCTAPGSEHAKVLRNNMASLLIDPAALGAGPGFAAEVRHFIDWIAAAPPMEPGTPVQLPGEPERRSRQDRLAHGIPLDGTTLQEILAVASSVGVVATAEELAHG